jgi:hypothetical protein
MKNDKFDRELKGPDTYEFFNNLSKYCQNKYLSLLKWQLYLFIAIAIISIIPSLENIAVILEDIKQSFLLAIIIVVLILMILQYRYNYMEGWQKSRYLAESVLSQTWLALLNIDEYNDNYINALSNFHRRIKEMKKEIDLSNFFSLVEPVEDDKDEPEWLKDNFDMKIDEKKEYYLENRLRDQINWYNKKVKINRKKSSKCYISGLVTMSIGALLTIMILSDLIPNLSYLGLFTTFSASIFSWKQTNRFDELKTTYSVTVEELRDFEKRLLNIESESEMKNIVYDIEMAISREHKLWYTKIV